MAQGAQTAAALIIGNEILSGKVAERNIFVMARELFALGVELRRIVVCQDDIPTIARDLNSLREEHDIVITSGGVGPTHDDVTMKAVAAAYGVGLTRAPEYEALLRAHHGDKTTEMHLRMADVPEGSRLISTAEVPWPTVVKGNVYVFPGVPEIFKLKFGVMRDELKHSGRFFSHAVYIDLDEASLAPLLDTLSSEHVNVSIGSYLFWGKGSDYRTKLTIDGRDADAVTRCFTQMVAGIPPDKLVRSE